MTELSKYHIPVADWCRQNDISYNRFSVAKWFKYLVKHGNRWYVKLATQDQLLAAYLKHRKSIEGHTWNLPNLRPTIEAPPLPLDDHPVTLDDLSRDVHDCWSILVKLCENLGIDSGWKKDDTQG